jgi:CheY-like chemotaxis protein
MPRASILIVEDDRALGEALEELLALNGYRATLVGDGAEALDRLARGLRPDLILADLLMPGMDGYQLIVRVRRRPDLSTVPVVLMTAGTESELAAAARQADASFPAVAAFLHKPFELPDLVRVLRQLGLGGDPVPG